MPSPLLEAVLQEREFIKKFQIPKKNVQHRCIYCGEITQFKNGIISTVYQSKYAYFDKIHNECICGLCWYKTSVMKDDNNLVFVRGKFIHYHDKGKFIDYYDKTKSIFLSDFFVGV